MAHGGDRELNLLGPFELRHGAEIVPVPSAPGRALLGVLAVEAPRSLPRERLAALFWADHSQSAAYANLRQVLARLRRALPDGVDLSRLVAVSGSTLAIAAEGVAVDLSRFESLVGECRDHEPVHGPGGPAGCPACYDRLHRALALHRGDLLADVDLPGSPAFDDWLAVQRERVRRQLVTVAEALVRRDDAGGAEREHRIAHAQALAALDPLREDAHRAVMRALADAGDRTAALAQFDTCRRIMADELGTVPEPATLALRDQIRAGWVAPPAVPPPAGPADLVATAMAPASPRHNLPGDLTPFVGRSRELAELSALATSGDTRLLTLSGVGGMGKTRLALELARSRLDHFPDGVFAVPLAQLVNPADVAPAIASAVGVPMNAGDPHHGGDPRWALVSELRHRRMLLVLDNFEHLLDGVDIVAEVLREAPGVEIVATSRERLNLQGEQHYRVGGLAYEVETGGDPATAAAVQLFAQAARRVDPGFSLDAATTPAVLRICRLVDGMPLGLELAAAWSESLTAGEIAEEIQRGLDFLTVEWSNLPERQRSIRAVFDSSWRLLDESEQRAFQALAVFRGGFTREAAMEVAGTPLPVLTRLVRKALLNRTGGGGTPGPGRYEVHELLRQFSTEQLATVPSQAADLGARHTAYYLGLAETLTPRLGGTGESGALQQIDVEHDNLRAALQRAADNGHRHLGLRLGVALWPFWQRRCHLAEGRRWFARFLPDPGSADVTRPEPGPGGADGLLGAGDDPEVLAEAYLGAAWLAHDQDDFDQADLLFDASLRIEAALGVTRRTAAVQAHRGVMARGQGRYRDAIDLVEDSLALARADGDELGVAYALFRLGLVTREHGEYERAADAYRQCLAVYERLGDRTGASFAILGLGDIARDQGDHAQVVVHCERSLAVNRELGRSWGIGFTLNNLALAAMVRGDLDQAAAQAAEGALQLFQAHGIRGGVLELHVSSAQIALARSDLGGAARHLAEALASGWPAGPLWLVVSAVEEKARLVEAAGHPEAAARLCGAAAAWRSAMEVPVSPYRIPRLDALAQRLGAALGPERYRAAQAEGAAWSPEQTVAEAAG
ncbi:MAG: BTAD domain-containing putative transcriptional regulator [Acidimicrobiales bacterium]